MVATENNTKPQKEAVRRKSKKKRGRKTTESRRRYRRHKRAQRAEERKARGAALGNGERTIEKDDLREEDHASTNVPTYPNGTNHGQPNFGEAKVPKNVSTDPKGINQEDPILEEGELSKDEKGELVSSGRLL